MNEERAPKGPHQTPGREVTDIVQAGRGRCPDCPAAAGGPHEPTCPIALDAERVQAGDRRWFEDHPGAGKYRRPVSMSEAFEIRHMLGTPVAVPSVVIGRVLVRSLGPGLRARSFDECVIVLDTGAVA